MGCRILVFYKHILASMNHFDSDMSNSTNMVVYFDEKDVFGQCRTLFMLPNSSRRYLINMYIYDGKVSIIDEASVNY